MKALRLPACASPVAYLFRFRGPRDPPLFVLALAALPDGWRTHPGQGIWSAGRPFAGTLSLGRRRDLTGSQAIHPMPLPRSKTPAGPTILTLTVSSMLPHSTHSEGSSDHNFEATHAASAPAAYASRRASPPAMQGSLPAGWLTFTGRELNPLDRDERFHKAPFAGPKQVLRYLSRYTHRVAISNRRLIQADDAGVAFRWKDYRIDGPGRWKTMRLHPHEFIR